MKHQSISCTPLAYESVDQDVVAILLEVQNFETKLRDNKDKLRIIPALEANIPRVINILSPLLQEMSLTIRLNGRGFGKTALQDKIRVHIDHNFVGDPYFVYTWAGVDPFGEKIT